MGGEADPGDEVSCDLDLEEVEVSTPDGPLRLRRPRDPASLLDEEAFAKDEFLPYWAELWPAADRLVAALPAALAGQRVLELGCGLGVPSLVAARRGAEVLATDWSADAVSLLADNARRNGLSLSVRRLDWREAPLLASDGPFDLVLAADVLYEARNVAPVVALLAGLASPVLLADPGRRHLEEFLALAGERFAVAAVASGVHRLEPRAAGEEAGGGG